MIGFLISLAVGAVAGWIAGELMKSKGSLLRNMILGIVGGFVGKLIFTLLGFKTSYFLGDIIAAVVGACIVIFAARAILKRR